MHFCQPAGRITDTLNAMDNTCKYAASIQERLMQVQSQSALRIGDIVKVSDGRKCDQEASEGPLHHDSEKTISDSSWDHDAGMWLYKVAGCWYQQCQLMLMKKSMLTVSAW
jgi:hypothetical protein